MKNMQNIVFLGAGSIGTALGNSLAIRSDLNVSLLSIEEDVVESIASVHINKKYFPNIRLDQALHATSDQDILRDADLVFIALNVRLLRRWRFAMTRRKACHPEPLVRRIF